MTSFSYTTEGVCSKRITFEVENEVVKEVTYEGGCNGNLQALSKLVEGMNVKDVVKKLRGIDCRGRGTSCADQLAQALEEALKTSTEPKAV